jgi:hypothetical protein
MVTYFQITLALYRQTTATTATTATIAPLLFYHFFTRGVLFNQMCGSSGCGIDWDEFGLDLIEAGFTNKIFLITIVTIICGITIHNSIFRQKK